MAFTRGNRNMAEKLMIVLQDNEGEHRQYLQSCPLHHFKNVCRKSGRHCEYPVNSPAEGCYVVNKDCKIKAQSA